MRTSTETRPSLEGLSFLPSFAQYLLQHRLNDFVALQLQFSNEVDVPLMKYLRSLSYEEKFEIGKTSASELFSLLSENKARDYIDLSLKRWKENRLPVVQKQDIVAEDITVITYLRKKTLLHFLPEYSSDPGQLLEVVKEIDLFLFEAETAFTNTYINLLKESLAQTTAKEERITAQLLENEYLYKRAEAITQLGSYKWDLKTNHLTWSDELYRIYGLDPAKDKISFEYISGFNNSEDTPHIRAEYIAAISEKRPFDFYYRIISKGGVPKILHAKGELILNNEEEPVTVIGTVLDVTEKQTLIQKLTRSEALYRQAEELVNMGNWSWDVKNNKLEWTDHLYRIYGLKPQSEEITIDRFLSFVHPDDRDHVVKGISDIYSNDLIDYTFKVITANGETKILRTIAQVQRDGKGQPIFVVGTERDITEKQTLIDKLQKSENLYKQAQALVHVGNWSWNVKNNVIDWSDELYRIYGLDPQSRKLSYEEYLNLVHPDDREKVIKQVQSAMEKIEAWKFTHKLIRKSGEVRTVYATGEVLTNEKGEPYMLIGTAQDVTEEYRIQHELRENQTFIRKITDATPSIIASYNINTGKYAFISEGLGKLLGYSTEEVMEKGVEFFAEILHPDDAPVIMQQNATALQEANANPDKNDMVVEFTYRMKHINGQYRWFHTYGTIFDRNSHGLVEHVLNISLDVTDQIEATEKIREQEHFIQQIADASPTILYLYDVEKQSIVYINQEIFFVLGYLPDEVLTWGKEVTEKLYHPDDYHLLPARQQSEKNFQQVDSMIQYECRMKNNEGEWRWLLVREIVFKTDEEGNIIQILGAALDINRRKEMEKTILQNTLLLEQSNASLEEFAYVASHDLKEPLRKISTFGDRLVATQSNNLTPDGKIYMQKIVDASQRMQTMISDLLSISMISNNKSFEQYSLQKILDESLQTLEYKFEQQNAVINADVLPVANIIPSQFRQLFQNLLSNSLKFIKPDVQPVIRITYRLLRAEDVTHYQLAQASQYHKLEFIDNGIGFENEFAGKIFAIFQRLHGRSEYEGSGIGLAICKKIVEHHGGIIYANGVPGEGSTFTIILPHEPYDFTGEV